MINDTNCNQDNPNNIDAFKNKLPPDYKTRSHSMDNLIAFLDGVADRNHLTRLLQTNKLSHSMKNDIQRYISSVDYIYNSLPVVLCLLDRELLFLAVNQRFAQIKGIKTDEFIGHTVIDILPALSMEVIQAGHNVIETGQPMLNLEVAGFTTKSPFFAARYWSANLLPVIDDSGRTTAIMVTAEEITDRKRLELYLKAYSHELENRVAERTRELEIINEKLRLSEERFHLILANSPVALFTQDKDLRFTWMINTKMANSESDIGKSDEDLFFPEIAGHLKEIKTRVLNTKQAARQEVVVANVNTQIYCDLSVSPTFDTEGELTGIACVAHDITEKKLAELELRRSEERFQKAFNLSPAMMTISSLENGRLIDANETWLRILGFTKDEVIGRTLFDLGITGPDYYDYMRHNIIELKGAFSPELSIQCKNGSNISVVMSAEIIIVDDIPCLFSCGIDVTREKRLQKEMARLDRLNLVGEMAASIGHEIRNPMTSVRGFLQMFSGKEEYQKDRAYFDLMIEELDRANSILTEYLGMAKDKNVHLRPCSIDPIIRSLSPIIKSDALRRDMNVRLSLKCPAQILADDHEIRQLVINLVQNGLDAMKPGGILQISTFCIENHIILSIKDNGCGLPQELADQIGTPFTTTKPNGTGLGLAVCYSIASRHRAKIDFETGQHGTTFFVRFPLPNIDFKPQL